MDLTYLEDLAYYNLRMHFIHEDLTIKIGKFRVEHVECNGSEYTLENLKRLNNDKIEKILEEVQRQLEVSIEDYKMCEGPKFLYNADGHIRVLVDHFKIQRVNFKPYKKDSIWKSYFSVHDLIKKESISETDQSELLEIENEIFMYKKMSRGEYQGLNIEIDTKTEQVFHSHNIMKFDLEKHFKSIVGMTNVKTFLEGVHAQVQIQQERKKFGMMTPSHSYHMIFKGNPGTGKTTVARIVADLFFHLGVLKTNKVIETDRSGLVAEYVGQTAIKTHNLISGALDGVLFIDEAYSLANDIHDGYGKEAIDALVKAMEDYRERIIIIIAGYSNEMDSFLQSNPGLVSRFPLVIEFPDYTIDELIQIARNISEENHYNFSEEAIRKLRDKFYKVKNEQRFGNGRYVRNVFENTTRNQAVRLQKQHTYTKMDLETLHAEDI